MAFRLQNLERDHRSGKLTDEKFAKEKLLILSRYPEVGGQIAKGQIGKNEQSAARNLKLSRSKKRRITMARYAAFVLLFGLFAGGFYFLGLTNSRYADAIHWERTLVAVIGTFAVAFLGGTVHNTLNEWHITKGYGHFVFLGGIVLFVALNQGIIYNPWDPALENVDEKFQKPTFLSHVGVLVVTVSALILGALAVAAGYVSAGFSTFPRAIVDLLSSRR